MTKHTDKIDLSFTKNELIILFTLAFIIFSHVVDFMIMMPLGVQLLPAFDITTHQFGLLVSSYNFTAGAFGLLSALYINRFDRKTALLIFYVGFCVGTFACAFSKDYHALLLARTLTGAFGGVLGSMCFSIVADIIPAHKRGTAMGYMGTGFSLASIAGVPFSLYLADKFDWHSPFIFLGSLGSALIILVWYAIPKMNMHIVRGKQETPWEVVRNTCRDRNQVDGLLFMTILMLGQFVIVPYLSQSMVFNAGLEKSKLWLIYLFGGGFSIIFGPILGRLSDMYGKRLVYIIAATIAIVPIVLLTNLGPSSLFVILGLFVLFFGVSGGRMSPAMAMLSSVVTSRHRASYMSFVNAVQQFAGALASYIAGVIVVRGPDGHLQNYQYVGYISVMFTLLSIWIVRKLVPAEGRF